MRKRSIVEEAHEVFVPVQWGAEERTWEEKQGREERERGREKEREGEEKRIRKDEIKMIGSWS